MYFNKAVCKISIIKIVSTLLIFLKIYKKTHLLFVLFVLCGFDCILNITDQSTNIWL